MNNRLGIYQFHDKDGIVDRYVPYLLNDIMTVCSELVVVVNGKLNEAGMSILSQFSNKVILRDNIGFDAAAWKQALCHNLGWEYVRNFDELILLNDTFFGPFTPFSQIFDIMKNKDVDFWGMTYHHAQKEDPFGLCTYGYWPTHIQSYFIVIRSKLLKSQDFEEYWQKQPIYNTFEELVSGNEVVFTKYFEDLGYKWTTYIDTSDLDKKLDGGYNHYAWNLLELLKRGFPFIKRKNVAQDYTMVLRNTDGSDIRRSIDYVRKNTSYDVDLIYENIIRNYNIYDLHNNLNLELIVTSNHIHSGNILENEKAIVVIHVTYMDQLEYIRHYLENVPEYIDILLTTNSETNKTLLLQTLNSFGNRLNVEVAPKKGRDFAGLLIAAKPYILKYDYVCFTHDKKSAQSGYLSVGLGFQDIIFENLLSSKDYVTNVLSILKNNKRCGLLCVPTPTHGIYFYTVANGWTCNFDGVSNLMKELNLNVSHIKEKPPISIGTAFWFKTDALRTLFEIDWSNRFLPEPLPIDGVINHQLERIFPYVAQNNGYLTCTIQTELQAESQLNQLKHMLKELSSNLYKRYEPITNCFEDYQSNLFKLIDVGIYKHQSPIQKLIHPMHFVYTVCKMYYDVDGYSEDNMDVLLNISDEISKINVKYEIDGRCKSIRLDPAELPCEVNIKATVNNKPIKYTHNGKYIGNWIVFDTYDPNIIFNLSEQKLGDVIKIKGKIRLIG